MSKVIKGSKDKKVQILKAVGNNITKIRCPRCKQQAHPKPDGKGGKVNHCPGCNLNFTSGTI